MKNYQDFLSKILRVPKISFQNLEADLEKVSGEAGVLEKLYEKNQQIILEKMNVLGLRRDASAFEIYDALLSKIDADDFSLVELIGHRHQKGFEASQTIANFVAQMHPMPTGFFLKRDKAKELLTKEPPLKIMAFLGYSRVEDMLAKENLDEVYSALRFIEDTEWQNNIFFRQYESLKPSDFENRPIELKPLIEKWVPSAQNFIKKKYHNVSHLKELGVIFIIPSFLGVSGEALRLVALLSHYLYEISYYSTIFERELAEDEVTFAFNLISTLRGDTIQKRLPEDLTEARRPRFLVIQRYLAKDDENDWRLFEPRINPEALHWLRAEADIVKLDRGLEFWKDTGWVADFFKTEVGVEVLVSFDLVDTVMELVKAREMTKYLYHEQEALWNQIFIEYFGPEELERLSQENIVKGWFEI